jgi:DNA-binding FadR family transcriptional regulator
MPDHTTLSNSLALILQKDIFNGVYPIGSRVPSERNLADTYNVSRITVRDALRNLTQQGLLIKKPKSGTYVNDYRRETSISLLLGIMKSTSHIDTDILDSVLEIRKVFEVHLAGKAVLRFDREDLARFGELLAIMEDGDVGVEILSEADVALHELIVNRGGNLIARLVFNSAKPLYEYYVHFFYSIEGSREAMKLYRCLYDAALRKDKDYACFSMERILSFAENLVREALPLDSTGNRIDVTKMMPVKYSGDPFGPGSV